MCNLLYIRVIKEINERRKLSYLSIILELSRIYYLQKCSFVFVLESPSKMIPVYQDVHVMIWIGFGFLMTFLKKYSQSAVGLTFLVGAILVQVALICEGALHLKLGSKAHLSLERSVFILIYLTIAIYR